MNMQSLNVQRIGRVIFAGIFISLPLIAEAQELTTQRVTPSTTAFPLDSIPSIDGDVLSDAAWNNVTPTSGFSQVRPNEGQPATQKTEVFIGYTDDSLYIGVVAYDDNPAGIIVADSRRDSPLVDTDSFQVIIDGLLDRQNGFIFGTTPSGLEYDAQVINEGAGPSFRGSNGALNVNWDTTWEVSAAISDIGWSAEMEIPFSALRYSSDDVQTWGINFQRNIRRNNEVAYWAPLDRQYNINRVSEAGFLEGIQAPRQRNLQFTPYALSSNAKGGNLLSGTESNEEYGFDVKYSVTPSLTLDVTYNTDFAQVEVDDLQVNLDRFSLFFPEKRPFFLENAGQFAVGIPREVELFFSRRIGVGAGGAQLPIEGGARLTGKVGDNTNVGFIAMRTEGINGIASGNDFSVARVSQDLPNRSSIGFMFVERDGDGSVLNNKSDDYNRTVAVDGRWGIGDETLITSWAAKTDTPGISGRDSAGGIRADYTSPDWQLNAGFSQIGENFNPEVGFLQRSGFRKYEAGIRRNIRPNNLWGLHELRPHINYRGYWDFDGFQETGYLHIDNHWEWDTGDEIHTGVNLTQEGVKEPFEIVDGVTVPVGEYDHEEIQLVAMTNQGAPLSFNVRSNIGGFFGGDRVNVEPSVRYRIGEKFSTEFSWSHSDIDLPVPGGDFEVDLARLRLSYSFTPRISIQTLVQYNKRDDVVATNLRFAWLQSANSGLYLVYNEVAESGIGRPVHDAQQFIIKYSRILDIFN
jgi:hypothetical protein